MVKIPRQGDILLVDPAPRAGHMINRERPYIVLSHDIVAANSDIVIVAPISTTNHQYPLHIEIKPEHKMKTTGKVLLDQLMTIDYQVRAGKFLEQADDQLLDELLTKVKVVFQRNK